MMKVLLVLPRFDRQKFDALTNQAWQMARRLTASGEVQCVIAASRSEHDAALEVIENVPIHRFLPERKSWDFWKKCFRKNTEVMDCALPGLEIFLRKKHFDLVHLMCGGRLCESAARILRERNVKYTVSCQPGESELDREDVWNQYFRDCSEALNQSERIFCSDHWQRRKLAVKLGDRQLIHWVPGVDFDRFSRPLAVDFRQFYKIPPSRTIILTVGRIQRSRNQKLLLRL